jgi:hypothetical protein
MVLIGNTFITIISAIILSWLIYAFVKHNMNDVLDKVDYKNGNKKQDDEEDGEMLFM